LRLRLKEWMDIRGVNQTQVAQGLGVTVPSVNAWIAGKRMRGEREVRTFPDFQSFEALCLFLECTPNDLLEFEEVKTPTGKTWRDFKDLAVA